MQNEHKFYLTPHLSRGYYTFIRIFVRFFGFFSFVHDKITIDNVEEVEVCGAAI
jgi:hypothetical protein